MTNKFQGQWVLGSVIFLSLISCGTHGKLDPIGILLQFSLSEKMLLEDIKAIFS